MEQFLLYGKKGVIQRSFVDATGLSDNFRAPLAEVGIEDFFSQSTYIGRLSVSSHCKEMEELYSNLESVYRNWGKFGPFGDCILVTVNEGYVRIILIARLAFPKPGLAADLVPFVRDSTGKLFFIGIVRKNNPGKGKPAIIGGFKNIDIYGYHLDTAAETVVKECYEESGMRIIPQSVDLAKNINVDEFVALVNIGSAKPVTKVRLLGTYPTSDEENTASGIKRVYETTVYTFVAQFNQVLNERRLAGMLKAGDDASEVFVWDFDGRRDSPKLAFEHHNKILRDALNFIRRTA